MIKSIFKRDKRILFDSALLDKNNIVISNSSCCFGIIDSLLESWSNKESEHKSNIIITDYNGEISAKWKHILDERGYDVYIENFVSNSKICDDIDLMKMYNISYNKPTAIFIIYSGFDKQSIELGNAFVNDILSVCFDMGEDDKQQIRETKYLIDSCDFESSDSKLISWIEIFSVGSTMKQYFTVIAGSLCAFKQRYNVSDDDIDNMNIIYDMTTDDETIDYLRRRSRKVSETDRSKPEFSYNELAFNAIKRVVIFAKDSYEIIEKAV